MIDDLAHLFTVVFAYPILFMVGMLIAWSILEGVLTVLLFPWRSKQL